MLAKLQSKYKSNHCAVHLKLTWFYRAIISQ